MREEKLFPFLLTAMILGIILAVTILVITPKEIVSFSSVQFVDPEGLPNIVRVNSEQTTPYEVMSFEEHNSSYNLTSTLELFRLYDTTEGLYRCLSPYQKKFFLDWTNETNLSYVQEEPNGVVQDLAIIPDKELLEWDQINLYFVLGQTFGEGDLVLYYGEENSTTQFTIRINSREHKIYFNEEYKNEINVSKQNDRIRLSYKNNMLQFFYDDELLFEEEITLTPGQFGFESRNALFSITGMLTSKLHPIEVPDRGNVINYAIDTNFYYNELYRIRSHLSTSHTLVRQYYQPNFNKTILDNCNTFSCVFTQTTDQNVIDVHFDNVSALVQELPWNGYFLPYWHVPREELELPWYNFNITTTKPEMDPDSSISLIFDKDLGIIITNNSISIAYVDEYVHIKQYPYNESEVYILVEGDKFTFPTQDGEKSLTLPFNLYNLSAKIYTLNLGQTVNAVNFHKASCIPGDFCDITLVPSKQRRTTTDTISNVGVIETKEPLAITQSQETIPSTTSSFNGVQATMENSSNFSLSLRAKHLDGDGVLNIKFKDFNDTTLINFTHYILNNTISIGKTTLWVDGKEIEHLNGPLYAKYVPEKLVKSKSNYILFEGRYIKVDDGEIETVPEEELQEQINVSDPEWIQQVSEPWRRVKIEYKENLSIYYNGSKIYTQEHDGPLSGYFSIETENSHLELLDLFLEKESRNIRLPLLEDPCRLRLVHKEILREETFNLTPQTSKSFNDSYDLETFFDYGKITVSLEGSSNTNNTPLDIHHWLVRE